MHLRLGTLVETPTSTSKPAISFDQRRISRGLHGARRVALRTMAPDRSHLAGQLDKLLRMSSSSIDFEEARVGQLGNGTTSTSSLLNKAHASGTLAQGPPLRNGFIAQDGHPVPEALRSQAEDEPYHPSKGWRRQPHHLSKQQLWQRIRAEATADIATEPSLATFLHSVVLAHSGLEQAMAFLLANKLADNMVLGSVQMLKLVQEAYADDPDILDAGMADMQAVLDRDPACSKYTQCMLYFKGFQAIQCHRLAHWLWRKKRRALAIALQSRVSEIFAVDIHPAAVLGRGVMFDHATGIVIGETAVVGDNVSMLHHVSLGGSGTGRGVRHPKISHGVLLGAGATLLGPITVGAGSKVGAGSVVVTDLPEHCVAVGVPANVVKRDLLREPVKDMDQCVDFIPDYVI